MNNNALFGNVELPKDITSFFENMVFGHNFKEGFHCSFNAPLSHFTYRLSFFENMVFGHNFKEGFHCSFNAPLSHFTYRFNAPSTSQLFYLIRSTYWYYHAPEFGEIPSNPL